MSTVYDSQSSIIPEKLLSSQPYLIYPRLHLDISFADLCSSLLTCRDRKEPSQLRSEIAVLWSSQRNVVVTLSVRTAWDLLLRVLAFSPGSEILMSGINIQDMVEIVTQHGLIAVPVDLNSDTLEPNLEHLDSQYSPQTKALLIAHLFGSHLNLVPYYQWCRQHHLYLFEDCAQGFTGTNYVGEEQADTTFFSFGPIKSSTALGGAVSLIKEEKLAQQMVEIESTYPLYSEWYFAKRLSKYIGLKILSLPWIYQKLLKIIELLGQNPEQIINSSARGFSQGELLTKIRYRPPRGMLRLLKRRLANCPDYTARKQAAQHFLSLLKPSISYPGSLVREHSFWLVPILVNHPDKLLKILRTYGFDSTLGSTSLRVIRDLRPNAPVPANCHQILEQILYLPVSPYLPEEERLRLANILNQEGGD